MFYARPELTNKKTYNRFIKDEEKRNNVNKYKNSSNNKGIKGQNSWMTNRKQQNDNANHHLIINSKTSELSSPKGKVAKWIRYINILSTKYLLLNYKYT